MWFCVAPGRNYMYFEDENKNADFLPEAVFSIIASIFGWFYFFWNMAQVRPDGVSFVLATSYSMSMLVCAVLANFNDNVAGLWQISLIWGAWCNSFIVVIFQGTAWYLSGMKLLVSFDEGCTNC